MTQALQVVGTDKNIYESLALRGDISLLKPEDKTIYLAKLCESLGLNPYTQPFIPLKLNGKEILYASKGATDQLASINKLTREITKTERIEDVFVATCKVSNPEGRFDIATGAVTIGNLKGDALANALMKAETKAKRRATLSFCGLGFLDESELETIPADRMQPVKISPQDAEQTIEAQRKIVVHPLPATTGPLNEFSKNDDSVSNETKGRLLFEGGFVSRVAAGYEVTESVNGTPIKNLVRRNSAGLVHCDCPDYQDGAKESETYNCAHKYALKFFVANQPKQQAA